MTLTGLEQLLKEQHRRLNKESRLRRRIASGIAPPIEQEAQPEIPPIPTDPASRENYDRILRIARSQGYMLDKGSGHAKHAYGVENKELFSRLFAQNGMCALHGGDLEGGSWHVDHDATTWELRGILCASCNLGLGHLGGAKASSEDAIKRLEMAVDYLKRYIKSKGER